MDTVKIGKYLAELRHEHHLTQEELGEKLGVTNKTVSRWETGTYLPPVDALQLLSEMYGISINEILSGKKLPDEEFKEAAEENIKSALNNSAFTLKDRIEFFKKKWKKEHAFSLTLEMLLILVVIAAGFILDNGVQIAGVALDAESIQLIGITAGFVWSIAKYNQMMRFVERYAYDGKQTGV